MESHAGPLAVPVLVVAEVAYLVGTHLGPEAEVRFIGDLAARAFDSDFHSQCQVSLILLVVNERKAASAPDRCAGVG